MTRLPAAPLKRRFAALLYEGLLAAAVTVVLFIPAGLAAMLLNAVSPFLSQTAVSLILIGGWWLYFRQNWLKKGQTLPMRTWHIGLVDQNGARPVAARLLIRYVWACMLVVFLPLIAYAALHRFGIPPKAAAGTALCWWILPWGFALLNPEKQFLYDYLAGTRLVDLNKKQAGKMPV